MYASENLRSFRTLEQLDLSSNRLTRIENLEGCECLRKLDLSHNLIGSLTSVRTYEATPRSKSWNLKQFNMKNEES